MAESAVVLGKTILGAEETRTSMSQSDVTVASCIAGEVGYPFMAL